LLTVSQLDQLNMLIARAGLADFYPASSSYRCGDLHAQLIPLSEIQAPSSRTLVVEGRANAIRCLPSKSMSHPLVLQLVVAIAFATDFIVTSSRRRLDSPTFLLQSNRSSTGMTSNHSFKADASGAA